VLWKYLKEHLSKGFIKTSSLPIVVPVIFVKKPSGSLCFYVDYWALNAITIKNWYLFLLIQEILNWLSKTCFYTKLDFIHAFNRLYIAKKDKWLTVFCTWYGLFEYLVTLFSLTNALGLFQHFINNILYPYLDIFCTAYINNILVYSNSMAKHQKHVKLILQALCGAGLQLNVNKCKFHKTKVPYLGLIIFTDGI